MNRTVPITPLLNVKNEDCLYESNQLKLRLYKYNNKLDRVIVSFVGRNKNAGFQNEFSKSYCEKRKINLITVSCISNEWYQYEDLGEFCGVLGRVCQKFEEVIYYGASMGGYGALLVAEIMPPDICIALSPQASADGRITPFDTRWLKDVKDVSFLYGIPLLSEATKYYVLFDNKHSVDNKHVDLIFSNSNKIDVNKVAIPFSGHVVGDFNPKFLGFVVGSIVDGDFNEKAVLAKRKEFRHSSFTYMHNLSKCLFDKKKYSSALRVLARARKINPVNHEIYLIESRLHLRLNNHMKSILSIKEGLKLNDCWGAGYRHLSSIYYSMKWWDESRVMIERAVSIESNEYANHFMLYRLCCVTGDFEIAKKSLGKCIRLRPDIVGNQELLSELCLKKTNLYTDKA